MKITNVEIIPITIPLAARYDNEAGRLRMYDIDQHTAVKVTTNNGIIGYGSQEEGKPILDKEQVAMVIDRDPFDFIQNTLNTALGMALYDVMGKHVEVPAYKLMGEKVRGGRWFFPRSRGTWVGYRSGLLFASCACRTQPEPNHRVARRASDHSCR